MFYEKQKHSSGLCKFDEDIKKGRWRIIYTYGLSFVRRIFFKMYGRSTLINLEKGELRTQEIKKLN